MIIRSLFVFSGLQIPAYAMDDSKSMELIFKCDKTVKMKDGKFVGFKRPTNTSEGMIIIADNPTSPIGIK